MIPDIEVEFRITGNVSPGEITASLGILPTRTWEKGDFIQRTILVRKQSGWCLSSNIVGDSAVMEDYLEPLLKVLLPKADAIISICNKYQLVAEFSSAIYLVDETPVLNFSPEIVAGIARLKAWVDIDVILTD